MYLTAEKKEELFSRYGKSNKDTGSAESQIALFSYRSAGGTNPLLSCVDFCGGMADALLHSDCAYGLGRRFAGFSRGTGFRGWHGGAY